MSVTSEAAAMLATLFPIRTVERRRWGFALRRSPILAPAWPASANARSFNSLMEKKAISMAEKAADAMMQTITTT